MTRWIADETLAHLRDVAEWPDLGPRYEVKGRLGRGGMGAVYAAYDRSLERDVAVKVIDDVPPDAEAARRLANEAAILAGLEHPGIVPVHDAGTLPDGRVFYVMKLVRGARLSEILASAGSTAARLDMFLKICDAVSFAHARQIVHRDLKPENVMIGPFGEVLVMDWGVAATVSAPVTAERVVVGTPGFMAPEQADASGPIDARADVYALGALLATMVPNPKARPLTAIVERARAQKPDERYASVRGLANDVVRFRDGTPVDAYRENVVERLGRIYQRHRVPILLVLAYMAMRVVMILWLGV